MGEEQHHDADAQESPEEILRLGGDVESCEQEDGEDGDQDNRAKEAVLFPEDRVDEVGVDDGAREVAEFIQRVGSLESLATETGAPDGVQRLVDGPSSSLRIKRGVEEDGEAILLVLLHSEEKHDREGDQSHENHDEEITLLDSRHIEHGEEDRHPDEGSAEVGLDKDQHAGNGGDTQADQNAEHRIHVGVMTQEEGEEQDAAEDGKLGWLEIPEAEVEPTAGTEDLHPDEED